MSFFFFSNRRPGLAGTAGSRSAAGRRKGWRSTTSRRIGGHRPCSCRSVAASEEVAVAEKLRALKELMPSYKWRNGGAGQVGAGNESGAAGGADHLFEEAANYIILLKTRVDVLQKLVEWYGPGEERASSQG